MFNEEPLYLEVLPKSLTMFGGGSAGGSGGSSGKISYPQYMQRWHGVMLEEMHNRIHFAGRKTPQTYTYDPKAWFGNPSGNTVYAALTAYKAVDIDALLASIMADDDFLLPPADLAAIKAKAAFLRDQLIPGTGYGTAVEAVIDGHSAKLMEKIESDVFPKLEVGMRDVNAVIGSSFVIAKEIALESYTKEVADFDGKVRIRFWELQHELYKYTEELWVRSSIQASELALKYVALKMDKLKLQVSMAAEVGNAACLAASKYGVVKTEGAIRDRTWKVDLYDHMSKTLAAIAGASPVSSKKDQSTSAGIFSSALGMGAMGAGIGAYLGPSVIGGASAGPIGAAVGGILGIGAGLISGLMR